MQPSDAATYERARRLANQALWAIALQRRRLNSIEPEDHHFILRKWGDFHFLVLALTRLRTAAELAAKVPSVRKVIRMALKKFDTALPHLKKMRDIGEHIDDYAIDKGRDRSISRKALEVSSCDGETWQWLGFKMNAGDALSAGIRLFESLKKCGSLIKDRKSEEQDGYIELSAKEMSASQ